MTADELPPHFHKFDRISEKDLVPDGDYVTVVPDWPAPEGTEVSYLNAGVFRRYKMIDGVWRIMGGLPSATTATFVIGPSSNSDSDSYDYVTDGIADDQEIQAAIDALPSTGGRIVFREGTYTIASRILIKKNGVTLQGQGAGTLIQLASSYNDDVFKLGDTSTQYNDVVFSDFYFDMTNQTSVASYVIANNTTKSIINLLVTRCRFMNMTGNAIDTRQQAVISNNYFYDWDGTGINGSVFNSCVVITQGFVINNYFESVETDVNYIFGSLNVSILGNQFAIPNSYNASVFSAFADNVNDNIFVLGTSAGSSCRVIQGCINVSSNRITFGASANTASIGIGTCENVVGNRIHGPGVGIHNCNHAIGNYVSDAQAEGIKLSALNTKAIGNIVESVGQSANDTFSAILITTITKCIVSGNTIFSNVSNKPKYGIREDSASVGPSIIANNAISDVVTAPISTQNGSSLTDNNLT